MHENFKNSILTEIQWTFSRSSGPGGQHVNTTDSKARLTWDIEKSSVLNPHQKMLIRKNLKNYIKKHHFLHLTCSTHKQRGANQKACLKKLFYLLEFQAFKVDKIRFKTKPTKASKEKRIKNKKSRSETKKNRQKVKI